jgi:hypothetical protein
VTTTSERLCEYYTGVGNHKITPDDVCASFTRLATWLERLHFILRSGGAERADESFERGVSDPAHKQIFFPQRTFRGRAATANGPYHIVAPDLIMQARLIVARIHPAWSAVEYSERHGSPFAAQAHIRNVFQVFGMDLATPSKFLVCWAPLDGQGSVTGGTRTAYELARSRGIPTYNFAVDEEKDALRTFLRGLKPAPAPALEEQAP